MSSRVEIRRAEMITRGPVLNVNNEIINKERQGHQRVFGRSKKQLRSERRQAREAEEALSAAEDKIARVLERVRAVKAGEYDGFCVQGFCHEVRFLRMHNYSPDDFYRN